MTAMGADPAAEVGVETAADPGADAAPEVEVEAGADPAPEVEVEAGGGGAGEWCLVSVVDVHLDLPAEYPEVVLRENADPARELRIQVGLAEGRAIAAAFRKYSSPRPLTHRLFMELLDGHGVNLVALRITFRRGQVYFAELETSSALGCIVTPCRPSDGLALVLQQRLPVPILVARQVLEGN